MDILKEYSEVQVLILIKSANLRKKYEDILIMKYVENLSTKEIADIKHKEVQTISNEICTARKKLFSKIK